MNDPSHDWTPPSGSSSGGGESFARLSEVIAQLREHCPWMGALTHASLVEYLIEETYELVEAVEEDHPPAELAGELGDVLLQVVLHARLAEEKGQFGIADVVTGLTEKMVRRNPHVFTPDGRLRGSFPATVEEIVDRWNQVKRSEKPGRTSVFDGIPASLPALALAAKTIKRAEASSAQSGGGGKASETDGTDEAVSAATVAQVASAAQPAGHAEPGNEDQLGDVLLTMVRHATAGGMDPERALRSAVARFQKANEG